MIFVPFILSIKVEIQDNVFKMPQNTCTRATAWPMPTLAIFISSRQKIQIFINKFEVVLK